MKNFIHGEPHINMIIGMGEKDASEHLGKIGYTMQVVNRNGSPLMIQEDYKANRVKVFTVQGFVSDIDHIG